MGAYEHLNNLGYVIEEIDLDSLKLENPYQNKEGRIFFIIRKEDLNTEVHKKVIEEETWFMKEAIKDKWEESEKKGHNIGLYCGVIGWLEKKFGKNGTEEEYQKYFSLSEIIPEPPPVIPSTQEVILPTLKVIKTVNIRSQPNTSASVLGVHVVGDVINVLEIKPINPVSVWVRDERGWSAVVHYGVRYME